jgi:hypothetical protein
MKIVELWGGPCSGKSTLCVGLQYEASKSYIRSYYVSEFIKDFANRKIPISPKNQLWISGNQSHMETSVHEAGYDYAFTDSSPLLCASFANFYSGGRFPYLTQSILEWEDYVATTERIRRIRLFMDLKKDTYKSQYSSEGRYESFEQAWEVHEYQKRLLSVHVHRDLFFIDNRDPVNILEFVRHV